MERKQLTYDELLSEANELRLKLDEATDAIEAIRTGQVDALVVQSNEGRQLYTLKTADQTYRMFIEKMNEGAVTLNKDGLILYCNSRFAEIVSMPLEKVIGLSFAAFVANTSALKFNELFKSAWTNDCKEEIDLLSGDNAPVCCLLSCNTLELDEGLALSLILTDLTTLKKAEEQLKIKNEQLEEAQRVTEKLNDELEDTVKDRTADLLISREHFRLLANNIPQMTWTNQPDGEVTFHNQKWHDYTGFTREQIRDMGRAIIIHPEDLSITLEKFNGALQTGSAFEVENRYRRHDGTYRWHLNRAVPLRDDDGKILFWVGTATDIEDQKQQMDRKDEFIGIASHELKTPLTSLKGYLQLMNYKKDALPPLIQQYINKADAALNKLQRLVNDLLDVSKIQAGKLEYALLPVNAATLINECVENARHVYPSHNFEVQGSNNFMLYGNEERLEQVLMNFVNNAVKYSPANNHIIIKAEKAGDKVRLSVADFGIGLSPEQQERIFERFYRVEDKKYMSSGLGMGLYISQEIINNHQGTIGVDSELGKGSTFYFEVPAAG